MCLVCLFVCLSRAEGGGRGGGGSGGVWGGYKEGGPRGVQGKVRGSLGWVWGGGPRAGSMSVVIATAEGLPRRNAEGGRRPLSVCLSSPCRAVMNIALSTHRAVMHRVLLFQDYLYRFYQKMLHSDW